MQGAFRLLRTSLVSTLIAAGCLLASAPASALGAGDTAPAFSLPGTSGNTVSLADLKGKVVYLDFWASWCVPCRKSFPWMNDLQKKYGDKGLVVVGINVDAKSDDAKKFLADVPAGFTVAFDPKGENPKAYQIKGMPSSVLIGTDGKVLATHAGFREEEKDKVEASIAAALPKH